MGQRLNRETEHPEWGKKSRHLPTQPVGQIKSPAARYGVPYNR